MKKNTMDIFSDSEIALLRKIAGFEVPEDTTMIIDDLLVDDEKDLEDAQDELPKREEFALILEHIKNQYNYLRTTRNRTDFFDDLRANASGEWDKNKHDLAEGSYFKVLHIFDYIDDQTLKKAIYTLTTAKCDRDIFASYLTQIPYGIVSPVTKDIDEIRALLGKSIYGLDAAKQAIIEHLVLYLHSEGQGAPDSLLLIGPPGVGKTALGHSVAEALKLPFVKISFASACDPMMLRGSSPGWRNSSPGVILKEIIHSKCFNPVFLWDEIDKAGGSSAGRVVDVLTELLDPKMSQDFRDTFIEIPLDLSRIFNILTANNIEAIPLYIRDRCNIIYIRPYTYDEKQVIIRDYIARKLEKVRPGEIDSLLLDCFDETSLHKEEEKSIGFRP